MTAAPARQPKGIPVGGQFANTAHAESAVTLAPPPPAALPTQREVLEARLHAARTQYEGFAQNEWAENILATYPDARYAHVAVAKDRAGSFAAGMGLYREDGELVQIDLEDIKAFNSAYDPSWDMRLHMADPADGLFVKDSDVFDLASIQDNWKDISARPVLDSDPFAHLHGIERCRAELTHGDALQAKAVQGYVQNLRTAILSEAPTATRIVVDRSADVESGLTFRLSYVEDADGRYVDSDLQTLQDHSFQGMHLDPHVEHDDATGVLYIDLQA